MTGIARIVSTALLFILMGVASTGIRAAGANPSRAEREGAATARFHPGASTPDTRIFSNQAPKTQKHPTPKSRQIRPQSSSNLDDSGPIAVFASIETAWKAQNVKQILSHFGKSKIAISIAGAGPSGGRFSKSQSYYLLTDLFKYTITKKFEFVQYRNMNSDKKRVFAVAERYYKRTDDGRLFKDKIYVSLQIEGDHWVVDEIKSIQ